MSVKFDGVLHLAKVVPTLHHGNDVLDALDKAIARHFGLRCYGAWRTPVNDRAPNAYQVGVNTFLHASVPRAFWKAFWSLLALHGTSMLARESRLNNGPSTWAESIRRLKPRGNGRWFNDLARQFGMPDGFDCPQGDIMIRFHSKKILRLGDNERAIINSGAQIAASRLRRLMVRKRGRKGIPTSPLSSSEFAALQRYSLGDELAEIARHMGVAVSTVNSFLDRARRKLGAKSRAHAVRIAIYGRLLGVGVVVGRLLGEPWWIG